MNNHKVRVVLDLDSKDAIELQENFKNRGVANRIEIERELSIMREVKSAEGDNILKRIDNTIEKWNNENNNNKYKLKYK